MISFILICVSDIHIIWSISGHPCCFLNMLFFRAKFGHIPQNLCNQPNGTASAHSWKYPLETMTRRITLHAEICARHHHLKDPVKHVTSLPKIRYILDTLKHCFRYLVCRNPFEGRYIVFNTLLLCEEAALTNKLKINQID